jgi:hypothetical protein
MCGSEQGHAPDPKSLAAFGPGDARRYVREMDSKKQSKNSSQYII